MSAALDVFTLGGLRIELDHEPVAHLRSRAAEALFVHLVCVGRPLAREWSAEFLWPERPHETSLANLRVALHHLRKAFSSHVVLTRRSLSLRDDDLPYVDRADFERLLAEGQLREALALYQGDFLSGFYLRGSPAFEEWAASERERLRDLALAAYQELIIQHAARAEAEEVMRLARGLLQLEPLHEPTQRLLARHLAQSGRRQAAIESIEGYRQRLREELGLEPDGETLGLLERVRHGLEDDVRSLDHAFEALPHLHLDVPLPSTPLLGRQAELESLHTRLSRPDCRLVTVLAQGGMGKTRLAIAAALQLRSEFPGGVFFVPLAGVMSPEAIVPAVVQSLGLTLPPAGGSKSGLLVYLRSKKMLLVLDNFDELLEGAPLLLELLQHAPDLKLLVTSRERLAISGEWLLPLDGLDSGDAAVELFVQRARRVAPTLDPSAEGAAIRELCTLVEGMPLAIELAASWAGIMSCEAITREVRASLDFLRADARDLPERHRSLRSLFDASCRLLSAEARTGFMRLSVFRGGFTADEARIVAGATWAELRTLVEKSLLRADGRGRFTLHELIRQYAADELLADGEAETMARRHFDAYLVLAERAEPELFGSEQPAWLTRLEHEWDNFRAALDWGFHGGSDPDSCVRLVVALSWFWRRRAGQEAREMLERALKLDGLTTHHRAALLSHAGHVAWMQGRWDVAEAELGESLALWGELDLQREHGAARTRCSLAMTRCMQGRPDDARPLLEEALEVFQRNDNDWWVAFALAWLAKSVLARGEHGRAKESLDQALALYRRLGNRWGLGLFLASTAQLHLETGALHEARALAEEACALLTEIGHKHALADACRMLGDIASAEGRPEEAQRHYRRSAATYREVGLEALAERIEAKLSESELKP